MLKLHSKIIGKTDVSVLNVLACSFLKNFLTTLTKFKNTTEAFNPTAVIGTYRANAVQPCHVGDIIYYP